MLRTYCISLNASVTITESKIAELITENESIEAITENERAENYPVEKMLADLKHNIYPPDASHEGKEMKANQPRNYSYPKRKFGKHERSFCLRGMKSGTGYTTTKQKIVYTALFAIMTTTTT